MMANLRDELSCSICLNVYTDPVTLRCGHNFCWGCIDGVLGSQEGVGAYSCPECREEFQERPALSNNITLRNIIARCIISLPEETGEEILCTYCVHSSVAAVRSCLHCEASLCEDHLRVHSKSPEHVLSAPSTSLQNRKCSVHKKILEYYCPQDDSCICVTCCLTGEHAGHKVEQLTEASNKKKDMLKNILTRLLAKTAETEERVQSLQERRRTTQDRATRATETFTALFIDLRRQLDDLEQKVLSDISRQEELVSNSVYDLIKQLEIKKDELSVMMSRIERLCNTSDPLTVLKESGREDFSDTEMAESEETQAYNEKVQSIGGLDERVISVILQTGLADMVSSVTVGGEEDKALDIVLDLHAGSDQLNISNKSIGWQEQSNKWPKTPESFQMYPQVLSTKTVPSGKHYWEWEGNYSYPGSWSVGMCYPSMDRKGEASCLGFNNKSWCLWKYGGQCSVVHDGRRVYLPHVPQSNRYRMCLDYEVGQLSFYELCDPIRHLHTFNPTFTEPLHVACYLLGSYSSLTFI